MKEDHPAVGVCERHHLTRHLLGVGRANATVAQHDLLELGTRILEHLKLPSDFVECVERVSFVPSVPVAFAPQSERLRAPFHDQADLILDVRLVDAAEVEHLAKSIIRSEGLDQFGIAVDGNIRVVRGDNDLTGAFPPSLSGSTTTL